MAGVLPDILRPGLRVVFCGTAAGTASARAGAYYAGPGNAFWVTLHSTGLTPMRLSPVEFEQLPDFGIGLTDICKVLHGSDQEVGTDEFDVAGLEARIAAVEPANLAFNGKNAARGDSVAASTMRFSLSASATPRFGFCRRRRVRHGGIGMSDLGASLHAQARKAEGAKATGRWQFGQRSAIGDSRQTAMTCSTSGRTRARASSLSMPPISSSS